MTPATRRPGRTGDHGEAGGACAAVEFALSSTLAAIGIIPVVALDDAADARDLGAALNRGGIGTAEITFRTAAAERAIRILAEDPTLIVGAGTVTQPDQVDTAIDAGARYIVSPGFSPSVVDRCLHQGVAVYPGIATATELQHAYETGLRVVKVFPASTVGGPAALRAFSSTYPTIRFIPTGGIDETNLRDYLAVPAVLAIGGSWITPADALGRRDWDTITATASRAAQLIAERDSWAGAGS